MYKDKGSKSATSAYICIYSCHADRSVLRVRKYLSKIICIMCVYINSLTNYLAGNLLRCWSSSICVCFSLVWLVDVFSRSFPYLCDEIKFCFLRQIKTA